MYIYIRLKGVYGVLFVTGMCATAYSIVSLVKVRTCCLLAGCSFSHLLGQRKGSVDIELPIKSLLIDFP